MLKENDRKKRQANLKFEESIKRMQEKRKAEPSQTQMAKVLYAYMRLYGRNPDNETKQFI